MTVIVIILYSIVIFFRLKIIILFITILFDLDIFYIINSAKLFIEMKHLTKVNGAMRNILIPCTKRCRLLGL